jgi:hypothetical protein
MPPTASRPTRANRVIRAHEKRIRTDNTFMEEDKDSAGVLTKIVDNARMRFSSVSYRRSARTGRRPRKFGCCG